MVAVLIVGGPVLAAFPTAALGALVVYAALRLVDAGEFRRIARFRRSELALALATTAAVLAVGVLYGVLAAIGLSILDLLRRVARPHDGILRFVPGVAGMHDVDDHPEATTVPGLVVYRYDAPLCFANAENFRRRAIAAVDVAPTPARWLLLNMEAIIEIDITAADTLNGLCDELDLRGLRWRWPGRNRTFSRICSAVAYGTGSAPNGSSPPSPQLWRPSDRFRETGAREGGATQVRRVGTVACVGQVTADQ
ncbi:MAG: STAS domain-containing protein [Pseudonocardia sp.]